jgi:hypothetical protein
LFTEREKIEIPNGNSQLYKIIMNNGDLNRFIKKHFYIPFTIQKNPILYANERVAQRRFDDWTITEVYERASRLFNNDYYKWLPYLKNAINTFYEQHPDLLEEFDMEELMRAKTLIHELIKERGVSCYYLDRLIHEKYLMIVINLKKSCSVDGDYVLK